MPFTKMKKGLLWLTLVFICASCSSILTGRRSNVTIHTTRSVELVVYGDTITRNSNNPVFVNVPNGKTPLPITINDSTSQRFLAVKAYKPITYWLNFLPYTYFTGFLVDEITGLKWKYPRNIYIDVDGVGNSYLPYLPMDTTLLERKNKITIAPLSIVNGYHPAYEFGYERLHANNLATQVTFGVFRSWENDYARNSRGFKASVERKKFYRNAHKTRFYTSLVLEYYHKKHDAQLDFIATARNGTPLTPRLRFTRLTRVQKNFVSLTPRIGAQHYFTPQLVGEAFFGLGLRLRNVKHLNAIPNTTHIEDFDTFLWDEAYLSNRAITNFTVNFDLNLRLAWVF